jgi:hypothetical protein
VAFSGVAFSGVMDEPICPQCGSANQPDANFCSVCGAPMPRDEAYTETHVVVDVPGDGEVPLLVVVRGANVGSRFALTGDLTTIGRHPESDVFLDDVTVSRRHAEVRRGGDGTLELADVGSLNGTYVNNERIDRAELAEGDQVQVGKFRLVVVVGGSGVLD